MLWDDQIAKDKELYPMVEPFINFANEKAIGFSNGTRKLASDLSLFANKQARRMLQPEGDQIDDE